MKIILANSSHDEQLRQIVRSQTMPGPIQIAYEREPGFFQGLETQGTFNQVVAAEENGRIFAFGCRSIRPMFINGERIDFGYLSGLRSTPEAKRRLGVARGYKTLQDLHQDGRCPGYITTIIRGNTEALSTIAQGRAGLPFYKYMGECCTCVIDLKKIKQRPPSYISVRFAKQGEEAETICVLNNLGPQYQFFPALSESNFGTSLLRDLPITNFLIAEQNGNVCGIAAIWNQTAFKQHRITKYGRSLRLVKPFINLTLNIAGRSPMPEEGETLNNAYFCFKAAENNSPEILKALLHYACIQLHQSGFSRCITGFHQDDPAASIVKPYACTRYRSDLFFAGWDADLKTYAQLDGRIPNFDPAIL